MEHVLKRVPGVPGVYDIVTCVNCGVSSRVAPQNVYFGIYLPSGNLNLPEECNGALREDVNPEFYPAYEKLFTIYKQSNALRDYIPDCPKGHWPKIGIGPWGTPTVQLWNGWSIQLDQDYVAVWHKIPDCGCGHGPCRPRVLLSPDGSHVFVRAHGLQYRDQTAAPAELAGWEQFKNLAMLMYSLPEPATPTWKWFGRTCNRVKKEVRQAIESSGRPAWQLWEEAGREMAWIYAARQVHLGLYVPKETSYEEYARVAEKYPAGLCAVKDFSDEDKEEELHYYVYYTTIPLPQPGTKVHFQTGSTAWSSSPFKAQVYRATYNGANWQWEVSRETFATDLKRRVLKLMDTDYQSCDRPAGITEEEDYFIL